MKSLSEFVVHLFDLIEAEGATLLTVLRGEARRARVTAAAFAMAMALLLMSVPLIVAGVCLAALGLMRWLEIQLGEPLAASLTGLVIFTAGGLLLRLGWRLMSGRAI